MTLMEKEIRRIVSIHFKEKYKLDVDPNDLEWDIIQGMGKIELIGLKVEGGVAIGEGS